MNDMSDSFAERLSEVVNEADALSAAKEAADLKAEQLTAELGAARTQVCVWGGGGGDLSI